MIEKPAPHKQKRALSGLSLQVCSELNLLELFKEIACRAGNIHSARCAAFTVLYALDDTGRFRALWTIGALVGVHDLLTVAGLGNLRHNACSPWYECFARALDVLIAATTRASRIESSGTSRKDCPGLATAGIGWRRTAIKALQQVYTTGASLGVRGESFGIGDVGVGGIGVAAGLFVGN